jgi:hypothetical protein
MYDFSCSWLPLYPFFASKQKTRVESKEQAFKRKINGSTNIDSQCQHILFFTSEKMNIIIHLHQNTFFRLFPLNTFDSLDPISTSKEKLFWIRLIFTEII